MQGFIAVLLLSVTNVFSANILHISPLPIPSHHIWNRALAFGLVNKGHNVTLVGPDEDKVKPTNYTHLKLEGVYEAFHSDMDIMEMVKLSSTGLIKDFVQFTLLVCRAVQENKGFDKLLNYPRDFRFDLIIFDVSVGSCFLPLIEKFNNPPAIAVTPFLLPPYIAHSYGNQLYPSYIPWYGLPYANKMSFMERAWNHFFMYGEIIYKSLFQYGSEYEIARKMFGDGIPPLEKFERHVSLVLTNSDPVLDYPQPLPPNFIQVGGLHTRKSKDIPQDLQVVLDGAKNGVILFSLGTNIRSDMLDKKSQRALLDAFSKRRETVIWKFESDLKNIPKNVIIRKWLPQNDILGHPNVKLFIGHGGALSTQESLFHGVPMICIPFFFDQHINARNIIQRKLGVSMNWHKITSGYVLQKLTEVLDNPEYTKNMRKISETFRDRTETPLERGIFWIEYVLRHGGADSLSTLARDLPYYKSSGLDVLAFFTFILTLVGFSLCKIVQIVISRLGQQTKVKTN